MKTTKTKVSTLKYIDLLNQSSEEARVNDNILSNEEMSIKLASEILNQKRTISNLTAEIEKSKRVYPINFTNLLDKIDNLNLAERRLTQLITLQKQLF